MRTAILGLAGLCLMGGCATGPVTEVRARYDCEDGQRLQVVFDHRRDAVVLALGKKSAVELPSRQPDAGIWYAGSGYELRGAGDTVNYSSPDRQTTRCTQTR